MSPNYALKQCRLYLQKNQRVCCKSPPFMQSRNPPSLPLNPQNTFLTTPFSTPLLLYLHIHQIFARTILTPHIARTSFTPTAAFQHPIVNVKPAPRSLDHIKQVYAVYKVLLSDVKINFHRAYVSFFLSFFLSFLSPPTPGSPPSHTNQTQFALSHTHTNPTNKASPPILTCITDEPKTSPSTPTTRARWSN